MSGEIGAFGDLATAGLAANALDAPVPGAAVHGTCANCGTALDGRFCHQCGQAAHVHRSLTHVVEEFLHGITHFDGKAWQTLPMLLFKPGRLTRDYILGKRARYVAPVPLFLLVVFLMFFVFSFVGSGVHIGNLAGTRDAATMSPVQALAALPPARTQLAEIDSDIRKGLAQNAVTGSAAAVGGLRVARNAMREHITRLETRAAGKPLAADPNSTLDQFAAAEKSGDFNLKLGNATIDEKVNTALTNPDFVLYKIQGKAYKLSFLLVPLSLPWLWLLFFWKRGVRMYDHAVFALYSISFMSLVFTTVSLLMHWGVESGLVYTTLALIIPLAHMFVQLKGAYALTTGGALWRTVALASASIITLTIYAVLMLVLGVID